MHNHAGSVFFIRMLISFLITSDSQIAKVGERCEVYVRCDTSKSGLILEIAIFSYFWNEH